MRIVAVAILSVMSLLPLSAEAETPEPLSSDFSRRELFAYFVRGTFSTRTLNRDFHFPSDVALYKQLDAAGPKAGGVFGIDVSHHNADNCRCDFDWNILASMGIGF